MRTNGSKAKFVYEADHIKSIIYVDVESMKKAGQISSPEFALFMEVKNTLPGYTIETKEFPKKNKRTYSGLTIDVMQAFIIQHEDNTQKRETALKELNKAKAEGLLKGAAYSAAKKWFLINYGKAYNGSNMSKKDSKRDALVKELLAKVDDSIITPTVENQKEGGASNG